MEKTTCSVEDNGLLQGAIVHVSESECTHVTWSRPIVSIVGSAQESKPFRSESWASRANTPHPDNNALLTMSESFVPVSRPATSVSVIEVGGQRGSLPTLRGGGL